MSALEQIRKRPAITIGIIGFALILFLFTGIDGCNRFVAGDGDTAITVDGKKIKITELRDRANQMNRGNNQDMATVEQRVAQNLIDEQLLNSELDRLGIVVTDAEVQALLFGDNALPYFTQQVQQMGFPSVEEFYTYAYSDADQSGQVRAAWVNFENDVRQQLRTSKFQSLLGAITANKLDAEAYYNNNAHTATLMMAKKDYSTVPDDEFTVTDQEIRDRYKRDRALYAIPEEQRLVDYIVVRVTPSEEDYSVAQAEVTDAIDRLLTTPSTDALLGNNYFEIQTVVGQEGTITDNVIKTNLDKIIADTVSLLSFTNDTYTIGKLLDTYVDLDSVYVNLAFVAPTADVDSVMSILNNGGDLDEMSEDIILSSQKDMGLSLIDPTISSFKETLSNATLNNYFLLDENVVEGQPARIVNVVARREPARIYEIAKITRQVLPSTETYNNLSNNLRNYIVANQDAKAFHDNAAESDYNVQQTLLNSSNLNIAGLPASTPAVKWAMDAKKGNTSDLFTDNSKSYILALAVEDIYDNGYLSVSYPQVTNEIRSTLLAEKKGEKLVNEYKGQATSVAGYSEKMGVAPESLEASFGSEYIRGFVPGDPVMFANIAVAQPEQLVGPIATENSVVVFQISNIQDHGREFDYDTDKNSAYQQELAPVLQRYFSNILRHGKDIDYSILRFYQEN